MNQILAAAARVDITPDAAHDMGSGPRKSKVEASVPPLEPLEANILLLRSADSEVEALLFVTLDTLYPGPAVRSAVEAAVPWLDPARIVVGASHTHRAPMLMDGLPTLGRVNAAHLQEICARIAEAVISVAAALAPAEVRAGASTASHSINRRRHKWFLLARRPRLNIIANAPNRRGLTDETITVVEVRDSSGAPLAVLWNYACHPVSHPDLWHYSSHFPHVFREDLRSRTTENLPVLFLQGFSGNTRPSASTRVRKPRQILRRLTSGPLFDDMTWRGYHRWARSLANRVHATVDEAEVITPESLRATRQVIPGERFAEGSRPIAFQSIALGSFVQILTVSGEPVCEYAALVRSWNLAPYVMCVGCVDEVAGYIPTQSMIHQGGYESDYSRPHFGVGSYHEQYQKRVETALQKVASTTYHPGP